MSLLELSTSNSALRWHLCFLLSIFVGIAFVQSNKTVAATIAIDTGHSATEPGAISASGLAEYSFNKRVTRYMVQMLTEAGHRVIDIDAPGSNLSLLARAQASKDASLLISVHHDSTQPAFLRAGRAKEFSGFSVFVSNLNPHPQHSLRCAEGIGAALIARSARPSHYHADPIPGENRPLLNARLGVHRFDGLAVLRLASTPAVLIEAGVIVNLIEERNLLQPSVQVAIAAAIASGIVSCVSS